MPKSQALSNFLLGLIYNGTAIPDLAQNDTTGPLTSLSVALHTASLGPTSTQATAEAAYTNYARQSVDRSAAGFQVPSGGQTINVAAVEFPQCGVTGATIVAASIGKDPSGAGTVLHYGDLNAPIAVSNQIQPRFAPGSLTVTES
jgi:hypothetical protein